MANYFGIDKLAELKCDDGPNLSFFTISSMADSGRSGKSKYDFYFFTFVATWYLIRKIYSSKGQSPLLIFIYDLYF